MRVLASTIGCNPALGSEALIGFKFAEALARRHEVTILASPPSQTPVGARLIRCDAGSCLYNEVDSAALIRFELNQQKLARQLSRSFRFDCVHRITPSAIQIPTWISKLRRPHVLGPLIAADKPLDGFRPYLDRPVSSSNNPRWHPKRIAGRLARLTTTRMVDNLSYLRDAQRILVGTRTALRHVPEVWREKCRLITYSGIEHNIFAPPANRTQSDVLQLLFVGRLIPYKGIELLLQIISVVIQSCTVKLNIIGDADPTYRNYLQRLTHRLNIDSVVDFLPAQSRAQLVFYYQRADVFCFQTLCDTYGIALLEAMSSGCTVIASDVAGAGEIVNGENGLKVPLLNPEQYIKDFADKIIALAGNFDLRMRLGVAARRYILQEHDWDRIGSQLLAIYDELQQDLSNNEYIRN
jgi:glycosyltransferase involved in cell wall biosynthesis